MKVEESIHIRRSPEDVFAFFDIRSNDKRWMASVIESEWLDSHTSTGVGRRGRMVMRVMGQREFADEVVGYEPGRLVAHRSVSGPIVIRTACIAEPSGDGCRVTVTYEPECLPGGVLGRLVAPAMSAVVRHSYRADLGRLKSLLEAETPAGC
jgi:uncharacterized membrane protein